METYKKKLLVPEETVIMPSKLSVKSLKTLLRYQQSNKRMQTGGSSTLYIDYILIHVCMCVYIYLYNVHVGLSSSSWRHTTEAKRNNIKGSVLIIYFVSYMPSELTRADPWPCMFPN